MNVLYLHQHFATREGAGGTRSYEFAKHLLRRGHSVTMVVSHRQASGVEQRRLQQIEGIDVIALGGFYSNFLSPTRRILNFLRFTASCSLLRKVPNRPDVVIATSTPLTIGIPGVLLARRFGVPFVFEVRDLWPQAPIELGALRNPLLQRAARWLERWLYRRADRIIALSPGMAQGVLAAGGDAGAVVTIPNASDVELFSPARRDRSLLERFGVADRFVVVHGGSMGKANGLEYVVQAARELAARGESDVQFLLSGYGGTRPELERLCAEWGLTNVTFSGSIPRKELGPIVSSCDLAVTSFANFPVLATNSPNKLFDGLAAGLPVIVNSAGWTRDLVLDNDCGTYVEVTEPGQLADAVLRLRNDDELRARQGRNARTLAETTFARNLLAARFCEVLESAAGVSAPTAANVDMANAAGQGEPVTRVPE